MEVHSYKYRTSCTVTDIVKGIKYLNCILVFDPKTSKSNRLILIVAKTE